MFPPRQTFHIFTDGSTRNGADGSWAAVIVANKGKDEEKITKLTGYSQETSGERMELLAIIRALEFVKEKGLPKNKIWVRVITDYSNLRCWFFTSPRRRRMWCNRDLYLKVIELKEELDVHFRYVRSRHGGTLEAHYLAKGATKAGRKGTIPVDDQGRCPHLANQVMTTGGD